MKNFLLISSEVTAVGIIPGSMGIREKYTVTGNVCTLYLIRLVKTNTGHSFKKKIEEQGWRSGESTRLPPMWPRFESRTRRHMWVEFVVSSCLHSERFFFRYSGFSLPPKTNLSKFQFDLKSVPNKCSALKTLTLK